jgi:hypothetical protein
MRPRDCVLCFFFFLIWIFQAPAQVGDDSIMNSGKIPIANAATPISLPLKVGEWQRVETVQVITPQKIFEYMDGAGELYLAYRLERLEVAEYNNPKQDSILVELYWVKTADDAYGLLSGDWGGEPVGPKGFPSVESTKVAPEVTALYGAGLLRLRSGNLFARIMAYQETSQSREAVLQLSRHLMQGRAVAPIPDFVRSIPAKLGEAWEAQGERLCFLRSHLVLNSVYFLSTENLLNLGPVVDAVFLPFKSAGKNSTAKQPKLILVRYPEESAAKAALSSFLAGYLPQADKASGKEYVLKGAQQIEDGWVAYSRQDKILCLVFECPDEMSASRFVNDAFQAMQGSPGR